MAIESYSLKVTKTEEGILIEEVVENNTLSEFELLGVFAHLQQEHSKRLSKEIADYEQARSNG